jgi:hypothetical protein
MCVDDILLIGSNMKGIEETKKMLQSQFVTKDLGHIYFLGIEVQHTGGLVLFQCKYVLDMLRDMGMLGCKPTYVPMDVSLPIANDDSRLLQDVTRCRAVISKLLYLTVTHPGMVLAKVSDT